MALRVHMSWPALVMACTAVSVWIAAVASAVAVLGALGFDLWVLELLDVGGR